MPGELTDADLQRWHETRAALDAQWDDVISAVAALRDERDDLRAKLTEAAQTMRRHADVCSRYGEPDRLREAADRLAPSVEEASDG